MIEGFASEWLSFERLEPRRLDHKTCSWLVRGKRNGVELGEIHWYGAWRQYVFHPREDTLFNAGCLRDIGDFCKQMHNVRR